MGKSIIQDDMTSCYLCGRNGQGDPLECHHAFGGPNRKFSDIDGLVVMLCGHRCHRAGRKSAHVNASVSGMIKSAAQRAYLDHLGTQKDFVDRYGRNYL